jgi:hypothetical protein
VIDFLDFLNRVRDGELIVDPRRVASLDWHLLDAI